MKKITLTKAQEERAQELHYKHLFIDCLCGNLVNPEPPERDGVPYLERVLQSGANVQSWNTKASPAGRPLSGRSSCLSGWAFPSPG